MTEALGVIGLVVFICVVILKLTDKHFKNPDNWEQ